MGHLFEPRACRGWNSQKGSPVKILMVRKERESRWVVSVMLSVRMRRKMVLVRMDDRLGGVIDGERGVATVKEERKERRGEAVGKHG